MKLPLLFLSLFLYICAYSQYEYVPGYIVKPDEKTEEGLINFQGNALNAKRCEFKKDINAEPVIYLPSDIPAYRLTDSKYYVSKKVVIENMDTVVFLECLISGKATIYYTKWDSEDHYYLEKEGDMVELNNDQIDFVIDGNNYVRPSNQYKGVLKHYFDDCPQMFQKLDDADFSKKSLIKLSKEYHEYVCKDEQCIIYEKKYSKTLIRLGADFSYGIAKLEFSTGGINFSSVSNHYQFSINAQTKLDEAGIYILQVSLGYATYKFKVPDNDQNFGRIYIPNDIHYRFTVLKPEIQFMYKIKTWRIIPYASAGLFSPVYLSDKGDIYNKRWDVSVNFTSEGFDAGSWVGMLGGTGEIGFETGTKPRNFSFSLFYEHYITNPLKDSHNLGFKCGFYFN